MMRYDAWAHQLETLNVQNEGALRGFIDKCRQVLPNAPAAALVFLGSLPIVATAYEQPISLLWRDAGALQQTFALTAAVYRLAFCPLGILGNEIVEAAGINKQTIQAVGVAMIGRPQEDAG
jgi:hypothetical protein